jgi:hypothetical protein
LAGDEWTVFPSEDESQQVFTSANADEVAKLFADDSLPIWQVVRGITMLPGIWQVLYPIGPVYPYPWLLFSRMTGLKEPLRLVER